MKFVQIVSDNTNNVIVTTTLPFLIITLCIINVSTININPLLVIYKKVVTCKLTVKIY